MKLIIEDDEGRKTVVPVVRDEITIGRQDGNTIKLTERNVSRKHARLWKADSALKIEDLGSYNGVRVNGDKIEGPTSVVEGDLIEIGDYDLGIQGKIEALSDPKGAKAAPPAPAKAAAAPSKATPIPEPAAAPAPVAAPPPPPPSAPAAPLNMSSPIASGAGGATAIININQLMAQAAPQIEVRDLQKSEMPRLVGLAKEFRGKEFYLMRNEWKIGRTEDNDAAIDHQSISRQHCKFVLDNGDWKIYDNKSANGVKVNGDTYAVAPVKPGDTVELGHVKFRFCAPGEKFKPPEEKVEGAPAPGTGKPPPTTAELIAGASKKGPSPMAAPPPAKSNMGMIIGVVVAVLVLGGVGFALMGKKGGGGGGGGEGLAAAKAAETKKDYAKASELANLASDASPAYKKKMEAEAAGQVAYQRFEAAMAANNPDAARADWEKCSSEDGYYCSKVKEKDDAFKQAFAKKHLAAATAAKGTNPTLCSEEVGKVLAIESGNQDAQTLSQQCSPAAANPPPPPPHVAVAAPAGPTQAQRDVMASKLTDDSTAKANAGNAPGAMKDLQDCIDKKPSNSILGTCYRNMGVLNARAGSTDEARKWFKKYLPLCRPDDCDKIKGLIAKFGG